MFCPLSRLGYVIGKNVDYFGSPGAEHHESARAKRSEHPKLFILGK